MSLGCLEYCFVDLRFTALVLEYSLLVRCAIALSGKYRSPVFDEGLPLLVLHLCLPHLTNELDRDFEPLYLPPAFLYIRTAS
jgi:hypothetical protein